MGLGLLFGGLRVLLEPLVSVLAGLGASWLGLRVLGSLLGRSVGSLLDGLGLPYSPPGLVKTPGLNDSPNWFYVKPFLTELHFSSLFCSVLTTSWGVFWNPFGRPNRAKFGQSCLLKPYLLQTVDFHEPFVKPMKNPLFLSKMGPKIGPRWHQDRFETI